MRRFMIEGIACAALMTACASAAVAAEATQSRRVLRKEVVVAASPAQVWRAWTTEDEVVTFFGEQAQIELRPGGAYEMYFSKSAPQGQRGSEGCRILSILPDEMLAFDWNAPPSIPTLREAGARTQVVIRFEARENNTTRVRLTQLGFGGGADWDTYFAYFDKAWTRVLDQLKDHFASGKVRPAAAALGAAKTWTDGHVTVTSYSGAERRQDFEMVVPLPRRAAWNLLATSEGFAALGSKEAVVELRPGGRYSFWNGAPNKVMAFVPLEMLATSGSAPPQFPTVRKGGTWGVYRFDSTPAGETRVRLSVIGWKTGDEWDRAFDYFLKNNAVFLNSVYMVLMSQRVQWSAGDALRQETVIPAAVEDVWTAFTTKQGLESWMVAHAEIDLRVGGKMLTHYDAKGVIGDANTIENTILSYEPLRMFSIQATKPPEKFPLKNAIKNMWTVVSFESLGPKQTRVVCCGMGFRDDEESQRLRGFFEHGNQWTLDKLREKFTPKQPPPVDAGHR